MAVVIGVLFVCLFFGVVHTVFEDRGNKSHMGLAKIKTLSIFIDASYYVGQQL